MGYIQTETAYYQPQPDANQPFPANAAYGDPGFAAGQDGWGLRVVNSNAVSVYGTGLYSFFNAYDGTCVNAADKCQARIFSVENSHVSAFNLVVIGSKKMVTVDNVDVADMADNSAGFPSIIAMFRN